MPTYWTSVGYCGNKEVTISYFYFLKQVWLHDKWQILWILETKLKLKYPRINLQWHLLPEPKYWSSHELSHILFFLPHPRSCPSLQSRCCPDVKRRPPPGTGPASQCRPGRSSSWPRTSCWSRPGRQGEDPSELRPSDAAKDTRDVRNCRKRGKSVKAQFRSGFTQTICGYQSVFYVIQGLIKPFSFRYWVNVMLNYKSHTLEKNKPQKYLTS